MNKKTVLSIIGVIVLGALGSGLWELVKPMLGWAWSALITVSTLGLDSLRDGMYAQAGASLGRPVGLGLAVEVLAGLILMTFSALFGFILIVLHSIGSARSNTFNFEWFACFFCAAISISMGVDSARTVYVLKMAYFYEKLETIAAPYLSDIELKQTRASFAQVQNRNDYLQVVRALSSRIEAAGQKPPTQEFF